MERTGWDKAQVDAYLERIGAARPRVADAEALRQLHRAHLLAVPFENLSIHLGERVVLEPAALFDKVVTRRRGGFCYELNGAFGALLTALGYRVSLLAAGVHRGEGGFGPPFDHLALRVEAADGSGPWLADVGFGRNSTYPLRLDSRAPQQDPGGGFEIRESPDGDLDLLRDGEPQYRLEQRPRRLRDFAPTCWWQCTSPESHFTRSLVCSIPTADGGRVSLSGRTLVTTAADGRRDERVLAADAEVLAAYRERFGIVLAAVPQVRPDRTRPADGRAG